MVAEQSPVLVLRCLDAGGEVNLQHGVRVGAALDGVRVLRRLCRCVLLHVGWGRCFGRVLVCGAALFGGPDGIPEAFDFAQTGGV